MSTATEPGQPPSGRAAERVQAPHIKAERASGPAGTYRPLRLTARGAVACIVIVSLLATLPAVWFATPLVSGLGFLAVSVFTTLFIRRRDLLSLCVCPPAAYLAGAVVATALASSGDGLVRGLMLPLAVLLAGATPWLFFGTAAVLVLALFRGLPENIRRFREELRRGAQS